MSDEQGVRSRQEYLTEAITVALDTAREEAVLTGWVVVYEATLPSGDSFAGVTFGPHELTTWRALGLIEWARRFCLRPDDLDEIDADEDDDDTC